MSKTTLIFHRGGGKSLGYQPNTLQTIEWALAYGAEAIEFDVVLYTKGSFSTLIVEPSLIKDKKMNIDEIKSDKVEEIDTNKRLPGRQRPLALRRLRKLIEGKKVTLVIHAKSENKALFASIITAMGDYEYYYISSFCIDHHRYLQQLNPFVKKYWIVKPDMETGLEGTTDLTALISADPTSLPPYTMREIYRITKVAMDAGIEVVSLCAPRISKKGQLDYVKRKGLKTSAWGVAMNLDVARNLMKLGIDMMTIDNPEELLGSKKM